MHCAHYLFFCSSCPHGIRLTTVFDLGHVCHSNRPLSKGKSNRNNNSSNTEWDTRWRTRRTHIWANCNVACGMAVSSYDEMYRFAVLFSFRIFSKHLHLFPFSFAEQDSDSVWDRCQCVALLSIAGGMKRLFAFGLIRRPELRHQRRTYELPRRRRCTCTIWHVFLATDKQDSGRGKHAKDWPKANMPHAVLVPTTITTCTWCWSRGIKHGDCKLRIHLLLLFGK